MSEILTVTLNPAIDQTVEIPGFAAGRVNRATAEHVNAGGKGVNVAAVLAGLGQSVVATGVLGQANLEPFEALFQKLGIGDQFIRQAGRTRIGIKIADPLTGQMTDINFPGLTVTAEAIGEVTQRVIARVHPDTWVVLAGSLPAGVSADTYGQLIDAVHSRGGKVALDTSGEPLRLALRHHPDFVKPNADELAEILGRPLNTVSERIAATRELVSAYGITCAVLSLGGEGAIFADSTGTIVANPPAVTVKSTVGAGDSMVAGAVFGLSRGHSLAEIAKLSTALGADAVTRVGIGIDSARSFEALLPGVSLTPMPSGVST